MADGQGAIMTLRGKVLIVMLMAVAGVSFIPEAAQAHRFNAALFIPMSDQGRQFRDGFMLGTTMRDAHPDQESDGHLGGLDVYVSVFDIMSDETPQAIDIVVAIGPDERLSRIRNLFKGTKAALLLSPLTASPADQGYNAAMVLDAAVRAQGGVDDKASLQKHLGVAVN